MLNWNRDGDGGSGNPLGDPATAAKLLGELRDAEPLIALNDLRGWLDTLAKTPEQNEQARAEVLAQVQDAGAPHAAKLLAQFLARSSTGQRGREASWIALVDYLKALSQAQVASAEPVAAAARILNAVRMLAKAYLLRYYPVPSGVWKLAYTIHRRAEKAGSAATPVRVHANLTSSATQELLRLLMLSASAPELMAPDQIEVADRVIEQLGEGFSLRPPRVLDNVFCFDPAGERPPMRTEDRPPNLAADPTLEGRAGAARPCGAFTASPLTSTLVAMASPVEERTPGPPANTPGLPGVTVADRGLVKCGIVTFRAESLPAGELQRRLAARGINTSVVSFSANPGSFQRGQHPELLRASLHYYNTPAEIERFIAAIDSCLASLG